MVNDELIKAGEFNKIKELTKEAVTKMLGFEVRHVGINAAEESEAESIASSFEKLFGFTKNSGVSSVFAGLGIEVMKTPYLGQKGHIAIQTNYIERAIYHMEMQGVSFNKDSTKYDNNGNIAAIYLKDEIGGFAVHLLQKK